MPGQTFPNQDYLNENVLDGETRCRIIIYWFAFLGLRASKFICLLACLPHNTHTMDESIQTPLKWTLIRYTKTCSACFAPSSSLEHSEPMRKAVMLCHCCDCISVSTPSLGVKQEILWPLKSGDSLRVDCMDIVFEMQGLWNHLVFAALSSLAPRVIESIEYTHIISIQEFYFWAHFNTFRTLFFCIPTCRLFRKNFKSRSCGLGLCMSFRAWAWANSKSQSRDRWFVAAAPLIVMIHHGDSLHIHIKCNHHANVLKPIEFTCFSPLASLSCLDFFGTSWHVPPWWWTGDLVLFEVPFIQSLPCLMGMSLAPKFCYENPAKWITNHLAKDLFICVFILQPPLNKCWQMMTLEFTIHRQFSRGTCCLQTHIAMPKLHNMLLLLLCCLSQVVQYLEMLAVDSTTAMSPCHYNCGAVKESAQNQGTSFIRLWTNVWPIDLSVTVEMHNFDLWDLCWSSSGPMKVVQKAQLCHLLSVRHIIETKAKRRIQEVHECIDNAHSWTMHSQSELFHQKSPPLVDDRMEDLRFGGLKGEDCWQLLAKLGSPKQTGSLCYAHKSATKMQLWYDKGGTDLSSKSSTSWNLKKRQNILEICSSFHPQSAQCWTNLDNL